MMSEKKYTFEDWVNDQEAGYKTYMPEIDDTDILGKTGYYPDHLKREGKISEDEYQKIKEAQKKAYHLILDYNIKRNISELRQKFENAPVKKQFLEHRRQIIKERISNADEHLLQDVYAGSWNAQLINSFAYRGIMKWQKEGKYLKIRPELNIAGFDTARFNFFKKPPDPDDELNPARFEFFRKPDPDPDIEAMNQIAVDEHFQLTILYQELIEIERQLNIIGGEKVEVSKRAIYNRYHQLYDNGIGFTQKVAYQLIEDWLINDVGLTKEEVKEKFSITLEFDSFTRGARNNRKVNE